MAFELVDRETLFDFVRRFGTKRGSRYFREGLSVDEAQVRFEKDKRWEAVYWMIEEDRRLEEERAESEERRHAD